MNNRGVTIIELLIVIAIIGILAAIAIPGYIGQQTRATRTEAFANLESLRLLEEQYFAEQGAYAPSTGTCAKDNPGSVAVIQGVMPGFQPGTGGAFSYCVVLNQDFAGAAQDPCFHAQAFGNSDSRVDGETYNIDCDNEKDF